MSTAILELLSHFKTKGFNKGPKGWLSTEQMFEINSAYITLDCKQK